MTVSLCVRRFCMKGAVHIVLQRFLHGSAVYICTGLRLSEDAVIFYSEVFLCKQELP